MEFFQYLAPTKVIFGRGTEARVGELCKEQGAKKVLIHYGGHSAKKAVCLIKSARRWMLRASATLNWAALCRTRA